MKLYKTLMSSSMLTHRANKYQKSGDSAENVLCTHLAFNQVRKWSNPPTEKFLPMPTFMAGAHTVPSICLLQPRECDKVLFRSSFFSLFPVVISHLNSSFWQGYPGTSWHKRWTPVECQLPKSPGASLQMSHKQRQLSQRGSCCSSDSKKSSSPGFYVWILFGFFITILSKARSHLTFKCSQKVHFQAGN